MSSLDPTVAPAATSYAYKASLVGAPFEFQLLDDGIEWRRGDRALRVAYRDITKVRMGFRPVTMQSYRFLTEIWSCSGVKISLASSSWRSLVEQERHDAAYTAFVTELHRRLVAAGTSAAFHYGSLPLLYWPGVVIFFGLCLAAVVLAGSALWTEAWIGVAVMGA